MKDMNVTNLRKDLYNTLDEVIKYDESIKISTKNGNVVIMSDEEYRGLIETVYLLSIPSLADDLRKAAKADDEELIPEEEVNW